MCWKTKRIAVKKIAEKDIEVFKIINADNTPYMSIIYQSGLVYKKSELCPRVNLKVQRFFFCDEIEEGYHSYSKENVDVVEMEWEYFVKFRTGWYSYFKYKRNDTIVAKLADFIIPKGTTYYENEDGEIVSETIKMI